MSIWDKIFRFDYSKDLHIHLKGWAVDCNSGYTRQSAYQTICLLILVITAVGALNYYRGYFNKPRFSKLWFWLLNLIVLAGIVFTSAYVISAAGIKEGSHCPDLHFYSTDCILFGLTAVIYTALLFFGFSLMIKWWSLNNNRVPF